MTQYFDPPFKLWGDLQNDCAAGALAPGQLEISRTLRPILLQIAGRYTDYLRTIAGEREITLPEFVTPIATSSPIIMSGHQPVVYHPGLLFKEETLERFAQQNGYLAIHIAIDTDEGDGGELLYPECVYGSDAHVGVGPLAENGTDVRTCEPREPQVKKKTVSIADAPGLYLHQKVGSRDQIALAFTELESSLIKLGMLAQVEKVRRVRTLYEKLAGVSVVVANSIVRWAMRGRAHFELPFSQFLLEPQVQSLLKEWVLRGGEFANSYNSVLEEFRLERKIKNPANPFPNMGVREGSVELPFWLVTPSEGKRTPCIVPVKGGIELSPNSFIAPRGSITTLLLRGFCSDLFIHGKGGAKYDPFVDRFAELAMKLKLAPFVVASQDVRLFPLAYSRLVTATELKDKYKEIVSHTEKYLDVGLFSESEVQTLRSKVQSRADALVSLKSAPDAQTRSAAAHRLNAINREVKEILDGGSLQQQMAILGTDSEVQAAWTCREYPFFFTEDFLPEFLK